MNASVLLTAILLANAPLPAAASLATASTVQAQWVAGTASVRQGRLVLTHLEVVKPGTPAETLAGRVLVEGDPTAVFGLWSATVGRRMAQAHPFLGREGPGASLLKSSKGERTRVPPIVFTAPVRVRLVFLDGKGRPFRRQQVTVQEIHAADRP